MYDTLIDYERCKSEQMDMRAKVYYDPWADVRDKYNTMGPVLVSVIRNTQQYAYACTGILELREARVHVGWAESTKRNVSVRYMP
jgi:hypothetical protein